MCQYIAERLTQRSATFRCRQLSIINIYKRMCLATFTVACVAPSSLSLSAVTYAPLPLAISSRPVARCPLPSPSPWPAHPLTLPFPSPAHLHPLTLLALALPRCSFPFTCLSFQVLGYLVLGSAADEVLSTTLTSHFQ